MPTCGPLITFLGLFGGAQMPQNSRKKTFFLVVLDHFSYQNGPIDLARGLFSSEDIGPYIPPTCRPIVYRFGPFRGAQMPQNSINKTIFWLFCTISHTRMGLMVWLGPYFQAKTLGHTSRPLAGLSLPFWVHWGVPKCPKTA